VYIEVIMRAAIFGLTILLAPALSVGACGKSCSASAPGSELDQAPVYNVSFERRDPIPGITASHAIQLPFACTSDGTIFVTFVGALPAAAGVPPPPIPPPTLLTSVSTTGHGQTFALDQIPGLYVSTEIGHYASDSHVVFLVRASRENKPVKQTYSVGNFHGEYIRNAAEQQLYIVTFDHDGEYKRAVEVEEAFRIRQLAVFFSGTFLAFGFDATDHSPRLVMLKEDGTPLKFLDIPKDDMPQSMLSLKGSPHPLVVAPVQLILAARSILMVQNNSSFPILAVDGGGAIRAIRPKLPNGGQVEAVIGSDKNLYVIGSSKAAERDFAGVIYEVNAEDGAVLRRFELNGVRTASDVACIHDGKFLSIDYADGKVVPLVGSAEPAAAKH
jgi:hypothetical protein